MEANRNGGDTMKRMLKRILPVVFALAVLTGLLGRQIATRVTEDYQSLQPEFTDPDMIETVMYDPQLGQLYVCYADANFVNVYTDSGEFRWAVGTPYIRGNQFCLKDGMLVCYGGGTAYRYDGASGTFMGTADEEGLDLPYDSDATEVFDWDSFRVYDGTGKVLVDRPAWYWVFDFMVTWCIAMVCGLGLGALELLDRMEAARKARKQASLTDRRAKRYRAASLGMIAVHLLYGIAMQLFARQNPWLVLGIFPITIHFILAGWIWLDRPARWDLPAAEYTILRSWRALNIASLIAMAVLFVLACTML